MSFDAVCTGNQKDMGNIYVNECADTPSQNWFVMADGRIALEQSGQSKSPQTPYP